MRPALVFLGGSLAMRRKMVLACGFLLLALCQAGAQQFVTIKTQIPIYASPPGTFFKGKGQELSTAQPNQRYQVLTRQVVPTLVGTEVWLRVRLANDPAAKEGWIFAGPDSAPDRNVSPM
jgi:hypothetical protein